MDDALRTALVSKGLRYGVRVREDVRIVVVGSFVSIFSYRDEAFISSDDNNRVYGPDTHEVVDLEHMLILPNDGSHKF